MTPTTSTGRRVRTSALAALAAALPLLAGCGDDGPPPATKALCEALRPDLPVKYRASTTDAETIGNIRRGNARFEAICPARP